MANQPHDYVLANASGAAFREDLNAVLENIRTTNSSSTEPTPNYPYQLWADTNAQELKIRKDVSPVEWATIAKLDGKLVSSGGTASAPGITFGSDVNTGFYSAAEDQLNVSTGGTQRVQITNTSITLSNPVVLGGSINANSNRITNLTDPSSNQDAATKAYVLSASINNVLEDTTPQLGGQLDVNGKSILFKDNNICKFGTGADGEIFHNGTDFFIDANTGHLNIRLYDKNMYIKDSNTTRFTFDDAGHFTATGNITSNGTITGTLPNANVRTAISSSSAGNLGTYAFLGTHRSYDNKSANETVAGTYLRYSNALADAASGQPSGTWKLMGKTSEGNIDYGEKGTSLYLRVA